MIKEITKYQATDGKEFTSREHAVEYQTRLNLRDRLQAFCKAALENEKYYCDEVRQHVLYGTPDLTDFLLDNRVHILELLG